MGKVKGTATAFRFDTEVKAALLAIADREGRSMANMLEWLIRKHCEREGLGWPPAGVVGEVGHPDELAGAVHKHIAGGDKPSGGEKKAVVGDREKAAAAVADSQVEAKPSAKKARNTKAGK